jgi:hypothetical protein
VDLVHILRPLYDNAGRRYGRELFEAVARELTERFGGLTAHTRAPAEGLWKDGEAHNNRDDIAIYEVMAEHLDEPWWQHYRQRPEERFAQQHVLIRAFDVRLHWRGGMGDSTRWFICV